MSDSVEVGAAESLHQRRFVEAAQSWVDRDASATVQQLFSLPVVSVWAQPPLPIDQLLPIGHSAVCKLVRHDPGERARCASFCRSWFAKLDGRRSSGICFTCPRKITNLWSAALAPSGLAGVIGVQFRGKHGPPTPEFSGNGAIKPEEFLSAYEKLPCLDGPQRRGVAALLDLISQAAVEYGNAVVAREDLAEVREQAQVLRKWTDWYRARDERSGDPCPTDDLPNGDAIGDEEPVAHQRRLVRRVLAWVDVEYPMPIALKDYAKRLGLNTSYLSALFSKVVGTPFRTYVKEYRIRKAQVILRTQRKMPIGEVGYSVGYTDPNSFLRAFREMTGVCPSKWRVCAD